MELSINRNPSPKAKPNASTLGFGKYFTDHIFTCAYKPGHGWHQPQIIPYQSLQLDPGASVLHYGQALFEGMKAFHQKDGACVVFRPEFNWQRMKDGAERLCMQCPPLEIFVEGIKELLRVEKDWIPQESGCSLYIRPTLIGTEAFLGVRPSEEYLFYVILSPVSSYYSEGAKPIKIWVEEEFIRAAPGGLGATKAAANYAASLKAAQEAKKHTYSQVLWLDVEKKYVEEVGTMNVFFVFDDEIATPALDGTILGGGTRDSLIQIMRSWNLPVVERKISLQEIRTASDQGRLREVFGTGTAAVVSPVGELAAKNWKISVNNGEVGELSSRLYRELTGIQNGVLPDPWGWMSRV